MIHIQINIGQLEFNMFEKEKHLTYHNLFCDIHNCYDL